MRWQKALSATMNFYNTSGNLINITDIFYEKDESTIFVNRIKNWLRTMAFSLANNHKFFLENNKE